MTIETPRLRLVPATAALIALEMRDKAELGRALAAAVPADWPPPQLADALPFFHQTLTEHPDWSGWVAWYALTRPAGDAPATLVGSGGFFGPAEAGVVEIGYSVLAPFQGVGYATEMMAALVAWAADQPGITQIVAETTPDNAASLRVIEKLGLPPVGAGRDANSLRFARDVAASA